MQTKYGAGLAGDFVRGIGGDQKCHHRAGYPGGGLDDVRHVTFAGGLVEVLEHLPARFCVRLQVEIGAVGNALEFAPSPREIKLDVRRPG